MLLRLFAVARFVRHRVCVVSMIPLILFFFFFFLSFFVFFFFLCVFFCQAEDGIRYLVRSRGLGDVYKRQVIVLLPSRLVEVNDLIPAIPLIDSSSGSVIWLSITSAFAPIYEVETVIILSLIHI